MILYRGEIHDTKEQNKLLDGLEEIITQVLQRPAPTAETVIAACDGLARRVLSGEYDGIIAALGLDRRFTLAQAAAAASIADTAYFEAQAAKVQATRTRSAERLRALGFDVTDSKANFLFVHHPKVAAKTLLDGLRQRGILVRWFDRSRISDHLRITVGTDEEMDALCAALQELTEEHL